MNAQCVIEIRKHDIFLTKISGTICSFQSILVTVRFDDNDDKGLILSELNLKEKMIMYP